MKKETTIEVVKSGSKRWDKIFGNPEFLSNHYTPDKDCLYLPVGVLCGVKIFEKVKFKKKGQYIII